MPCRCNVRTSERKHGEGRERCDGDEADDGAVDLMMVFLPGQPTPLVSVARVDTFASKLRGDVVIRKIGVE